MHVSLASAADRERHARDDTRSAKRRGQRWHPRHPAV